MNQPQYPNQFPGQPFPGQAPGFAPQGAPSAPAQPAQYVPGYQPMPQQPQGYAPPAQYPNQLPQNPGNNSPMLDVDSATDEGAQYPQPTFAGGAPWHLTVSGCVEQPSFHDQGTMIFWITATVRQSPDPAFQPGMTVSVPIKKLNDRKYNNAAQGRLKKFLAVTCGESEFGQAPGHFAGRKLQALQGQLNGRTFSVSFTYHTTQAIDSKTGQPRTYMRPVFQPG